MTISVTVRYYASFKQIAGLASERYLLEPHSTIKDLLNVVFSKHDKLISYAHVLLFARNNLYCEHDAILRDEDIVDLMPPVAGGA